MKLVRSGERGRERPDLLDAAGRLRALSAHVADIAGPALRPESLTRLAALDPESLPPVERAPRIGACIGHVGKFVCVGLNYADPAAESGMPVPAEPVLFMKATTAIAGTYDDVEIPRGARKADREVELGIVIGKPAKYVSAAEALAYVAGLLRRERHLRARVPDRAQRRPVGQGQGLRHVRPHRPVAGHRRRCEGPAGSPPVAELKPPGDDAAAIKGAISGNLALKHTAEAAFKEQFLLQSVRAQTKIIRTTRNGGLLRERRVLKVLEPAQA